MVAFNDHRDSEKGKVAVLSVDGSTMSWGTVVTFDEGDVVAESLSSCVSPSGEVTIVYEDEDTDNSHHGKFVVVTVDGTTPSFTDPVTFESAYTEKPSAAYDINAGKAVVVYQDQGNSSFVTACVLNADVYNLTAENFIGISSGGAVADTDAATVDIIGTVNSEQTGLTAGQKYYVQNDGTLSTTAGNPSVLAGTAISATKLVVKT